MVSEQPTLIVADAGPLIVLSRIGRLNLLPQVFGEVWITDVVRHELLGQGAFPGQTEITAALEHWLHSAPVDMNNCHTNNPDIDPGEARSRPRGGGVRLASSGTLRRAWAICAPVL